jgi:hypothetical protein
MGWRGGGRGAQRVPNHRVGLQSSVKRRPATAARDVVA